jgi:ribosome modulation factor
MVLAHRWSAQHVHGFTIEDLQVDHCCPAGPSTLCVQHVKPETADVNRALQAERAGLGRAYQSLQTRQYWLYVWRGIEEAPVKIVRDEVGVPWFEPPSWLRPFMPRSREIEF